MNSGIFISLFFIFYLNFKINLLYLNIYLNKEYIIIKYKFKEQSDGITFIEKDDEIVAKYKLSYKWKEVNYSFKEDSVMIRLYDKYKKYLDVEVKFNVDEVQMIP